METETKAPSLVASDARGTPAVELLIPSSQQHPAKGRVRNKKPWYQRRQGRDVSEQTESLLALFFVVAICRAPVALNQSTSAITISLVAGGRQQFVSRSRQFVFPASRAAVFRLCYYCQVRPDESRRASAAVGRSVAGLPSTPRIGRVASPCNSSRGRRLDAPGRNARHEDRSRGRRTSS
jgi:hypothetical protein